MQQHIFVSFTMVSQGLGGIFLKEMNWDA